MKLHASDRTIEADSGVGREWMLAFAVSFGAALLVITPFFLFGNAWGQDFMFHLTSWMDVAGQWKEGILYPRWAEGANSGFGEPRFIFYPPLSWILGAGLGLTLPWRFVPGVFIAIVQTFAGVSSYALAKRLLSKQGALWVSACYVANPYALLDIYARSAFAELLASAVIPAALLASLELSGALESNERSRPCATAFFAVAFAAVWLSNVPAGVMVSYSVALVFACAAVEERSLWPFWRAAKGLLLGFGLIGFYIVPAIYEQHWTSISQMFPKGSLQFLYAQLDHGSRTGRLPFHWIASNVAVLLMATTGGAGVVVYHKIFRKEQIKNQKPVWRVLFLLAVAATFFMTRLSSVFWKLLPKLFVMQFPWRWMGILAIVYALVFGNAISTKPGRWIWSTVALAIVIGCGTTFVKKTWWNTQDIFALQTSIANDEGFFGWPEYSPKGVSFFDLPQNSLRVRIMEDHSPNSDTSKAQVRVTRWTAVDKRVSITSNLPASVALRLFNYPAWRIELNGKTVTAQPNRLDQVILPVPAGPSDIHVVFVRTLDRVGGDILSAVSFLALVILCLASNKSAESKQI